MRGGALCRRTLPGQNHPQGQGRAKGSGKQPSRSNLLRNPLDLAMPEAARVNSASLPHLLSRWTSRKNERITKRKGKNRQSLTPGVLAALPNQGRARLCPRQSSSAIP